MKRTLTLIHLVSLAGFVTQLFLSHSSHSQNLLSNGNFEAGLTGWNNLSGDGGTAVYSLSRAEKSEGIQSLMVVASVKGANPWSLQSIHGAWASVKDTVYILSFYAKAATDTSKIRVVLQSGAPNSSYDARDFLLSTAWSKYEWVLKSKAAGLDFKFQYFQLGTFWIDDVQIVKQHIVPASPMDVFTVVPDIRYQTFEGFGGSLAFYESWISQHPSKEKIYQHLFEELDLDWLRLRNTYRNETNFQPTDAIEFAQKQKAYNPQGRTLLCSWSPPANLKSRNTLDSGTLAKENGQFVYGKFGDYWKNSLLAYGKVGIQPDMISIQNEPDWLTTKWETCKFTPTETADFPGYDKALDSVHAKLSSLNYVPKMLGAEPLGVGYNNFNNFTMPIKNRAFLYGYNYHLYHGGDPSTPDSFNEALANIAINFSDKPNIMSEYELVNQGWLKTAWLINNVLVKANCASFYYWNVAWPKTGLVNLENPFEKGSWTTAEGYSLSPIFYAYKHFTKHIKPNFLRISGLNQNKQVRSSAFLSPGKDTVVAVLINTSSIDIKTKVQLETDQQKYFDGYLISNSKVYQSVESSYYVDKGPLLAKDSLLLPANSITTVVMQILGVIATEHSASEMPQHTAICSPNPFHQTTALSFKGLFSYTVVDLLGKVLAKGAASETIELGNDLPSGVYSIKVENNLGSTTLKVIKK